MTIWCSHGHCRFENGVRHIGMVFWAAVALAASFWLLLAMEMLRRSRTRSGAEWKRDAEPEGRAPIYPPAIASDNPAGGR